jgi:hypothetical protein
VDLAGSPAACRRILTRVFFSAIEEQEGKKGGNADHYVYYVPKSPYCASISVPELFPQYEAWKGDPQTCPNGDLMQMMSMKKIVFTFTFRSSDQETCPGYSLIHRIS